ncbi:MAG: choice-of-anchor L domain-containing protein, partial [Bacteroidetes bacterium]|nr:choice-of-anchor L domain-containing protein [Bacteroidota bacterium]
MVKTATTHIPLSLYLVLVLAIGFSPKSIAQFTVNQGSNITMTPLEFVQTYLVGTGVSVSNATYNGSANPLNIIRLPSNTRDQIGNFTATGSALETLGLKGGIILSSGKVQDASSAVFPGGLADYESFSGGDADLTLLAGGVTSKDKSVLEFDFVPVTDVITFRYVFSSEEFDQYCGNQYNDSFGFFIRGPGIPPGP